MTSALRRPAIPSCATALRVWIGISTALGLLMACGAAPAQEAATKDARPSVLAQAIAQPVPVSAVRGLLYARAFELREPFVYTFLREQPRITRGTLLVVEVDPEVARPRQVDVPVLFAGDTPAHLTNSGFPSGRMVVIVPEWIDLARDPLYFGSTELPERIDRPRGRLEAMAANGRGAQPFAAATRAEASSAGGKPLDLADSFELFRTAADLIERYAPEEAEWGAIYRTPRVGE